MALCVLGAAGRAARPRPLRHAARRRRHRVVRRAGVRQHRRGDRHPPDHRRPAAVRELRRLVAAVQHDRRRPAPERGPPGAAARRAVAARRRPPPRRADRGDRSTAPSTFAIVTGGGTAGHVLPALAIADALVAAGHPRAVHPLRRRRARHRGAAGAADRLPDDAAARCAGSSAGSRLANLGAIGGLAARRGAGAPAARAAAPGGGDRGGRLRERRPSGWPPSCGGCRSWWPSRTWCPGAANRLLARFAKASARELPRHRPARGPSSPATRSAPRSRRSTPTATAPPPSGPSASTRLGSSCSCSAARSAPCGSTRPRVGGRPRLARPGRPRAPPRGRPPGLGRDLRERRRTTPARCDRRLVPYEDDMPAALAAADVAVCRPGSSTCFELAAAGAARGARAVALRHRRPADRQRPPPRRRRRRGARARRRARRRPAGRPRSTRILADRDRRAAMAAAARSLARPDAAAAIAALADRARPWLTTPLDLGAARRDPRHQRRRRGHERHRHAPARDGPPGQRARTRRRHPVPRAAPRPRRARSPPATPGRCPTRRRRRGLHRDARRPPARRGRTRPPGVPVVPPRRGAGGDLPRRDHGRGGRHPRQDHHLRAARHAPDAARASSPGYIVGAEVAGLGRSAAWGGAGPLVVEADESDGTFLALGAALGDRHQRRARPPRALGRRAGAARGVRAVRRRRSTGRPCCAPTTPAPLALVAHAAPPRHLRHRRRTPTTGSSDVGHRGHRGPLHPRPRRRARCRSRCPAAPGIHNARNAAGGDRAGPHPRRRRSTTPPRRSAGFRGVARRFEVRGEAGGVVLVDSYDHLPTEVAAALAAARAGRLGPGGVLLPAPPLQPHRGARAAPSPTAFADADVLVVTGIYPAGEAPRPGVTGKIVVDAVLDAHPWKQVAWLPTLDDVVALPRRHAAPRRPLPHPRRRRPHHRPAPGARRCSRVVARERRAT